METRKDLLLYSPSIMLSTTKLRCCSGYVALAVVSQNGSLQRDLDTGLGGDRAGNMVAFATEALKLVEEFIITSTSQGKDVKI